MPAPARLPRPLACLLVSLSAGEELPSGVTEASSAAALKAACKEWGLPVSGAKGALWQRLLDQARLPPSVVFRCHTACPPLCPTGQAAFPTAAAITVSYCCYAAPPLLRLLCCCCCRCRTAWRARGEMRRATASSAAPPGRSWRNTKLSASASQKPRWVGQQSGWLVGCWHGTSVAAATLWPPLQAVLAQPALLTLNQLAPATPLPCL